MTTSCSIPGMNVPRSRFPDPQQRLADPGTGEQRLVLAGGCFWCVEAVFVAMDGVLSVTSGYTGGDADTANYTAVCTGQTGHAEAVDIRYDPERVSFEDLLKVFFSVAHDPTQLNRQGHDQGTQYRSAVFYANEAQKQVVAAYIEQLQAADVYPDPIVTTLEPLATFHPAEDYHQDYAARNPHQPYIMAVAGPKVEKLRQNYGDRLKPDLQD